MSISSISKKNYRLSLFDHGKTLVELLTKLKSYNCKVHRTDDNYHHNKNSNDDDDDDTHHDTREGIRKEVEDVTLNILTELEEARKFLFLAHESRDNIVRKMEETLQQLIKVDPDNTTSYQQLVKKFEVFRSQNKAQGFALSYLGSIHSSQSKMTTTTTTTTTTTSLSRVEDFPFEENYKHLEEKNHKKCLKFFSLFPDGAEINKRELINWWVGMELIKRDSFDENKKEGEIILDKLVRNGFITRISKDKHTYKIREGVQLKLNSKVDSSWHGEAHVLTRDVNDTKGDNVMQKDPEIPESVETLLNIDETDLNNNISTMLSKLKKLKVVQLGKWKYDKNYVVVKDLEELRNALKNLKEVHLLSFRGISGVVKLPDSIYGLSNLKVLDLRACHNLESMPQGIHLLEKLMYLDLSECYLLDSVPNGIARLSNLRVLKGFVIPPYQEPEGVGNQIKKNASSNSCAFRDLSKLTELKKLCIRTRRMEFPTRENVETLCKMKQLNILRIAWVKSSRYSTNWEDLVTDSCSYSFEKLEKLELQAAPEDASQLLELISRSDNTCLKKLYIRGGGLKQLGQTHQSTTFPEIKDVRLRYLHKLDVNWVHFKESFPTLKRLEVYGCPNLIDFPYDNNGVWESSERIVPPWVPLDMYHPNHLI